MNSGESKGSAIKEIFFGLDELKKEPWKSLWKKRFQQYLFIFGIVSAAGIFILGILLSFGFNYVPTDLDNARFFLSAMVQAQAAIVTLVITLTLIAIQMASAAYTPRVVDVMKKNPDIWYLLIIYIGAMSYGFIALKLVSDPDRFLVSSVLILGVYTFCILFLYMKNTIALLRPDHVVEMLVNEINAENIHQKEWKDDIMQPVFDVVHASIMRFDVTTTRTGLNALSERVLELFLAFDEKNREKKSHDVTEHFCKHIQRSALVALRNEDEGIIREIIVVLKNFGTHAAANGMEGATRRVVETLRDVGIHAADKGLEYATVMAANSLEAVGIHAADKGMEHATGWVAYALEAVGTHAADKGMEGATTRVAYALGVVGIHAADKGLEGATRRVVETLRDVGIHAADKGLEGATTRVADALGVVGTHAADKGLEYATGWVADALGVVGIHAADKGMDYATGWVVRALCRVGLKESGQNAAAKSLAQLMFHHKSTIPESIKKFESELKPEQKDQFTTSMKKVNKDLHKLESSEQPQ